MFMGAQEERAVFAQEHKKNILHFRDSMTEGTWYIIRENETKQRYKLIQKYGRWGLFETPHGIRVGISWHELSRKGVCHVSVSQE